MKICHIFGMAWNFEKPNLISGNESLHKSRKIDDKKLLKNLDKRGMVAKLKSKKELIKFKKVTSAKLRNLTELTDAPKIGEQIRIITQGSFNSFAFITLVLKTEQIEEMYLVTYSISDVVTDMMFSMLNNGAVGKLSIMISESMLARKPEKTERLKKKYRAIKNTQNIRIKFNWNHAKIILLKTEKNLYIIEGSGNLTGNAKIEQYVFDNNKQIYDFHKSWMDEEFSKIEKREEIWE